MTPFPTSPFYVKRGFDAPIDPNSAKIVTRFASDHGGLYFSGADPWSHSRYDRWAAIATRRICRRSHHRLLHPDRVSRVDAVKRCPFCGEPEHPVVEVAGVKIRGCPAVPKGFVVTYLEPPSVSGERPWRDVDVLQSRIDSLTTALEAIASKGCEGAGRCYCYDLGSPDEVAYCPSCEARAALTPDDSGEDE